MDNSKTTKKRSQGKFTTYISDLQKPVLKYHKKDDVLDKSIQRPKEEKRD